MVTRKVNTSFWNGKRVFLTGHTGFKGSWLSIWLHAMGADVRGYSLVPNTNPSLFEIAGIGGLIDSTIGDIRDAEFLSTKMEEFKPDVLIHMAAQPLVRLSYQEPVATYSTNVMGTVHVLEAARNCESLKAIVSVTTDKCYENKEWVYGYREIEPLGGHDPYSNSKACAELVTSAYQKSFFNQEASPALASARAGNVIGGGDWALDRLVPDAIRAFGAGDQVIIRNPLAIRPWQHVLEPLAGYLILAENLYSQGKEFAQAWNFGPEDKDCKSVEWILNELVSLYGGGAGWKLDAKPQPHEAMFLKLDCSKAKTFLKWEPKWDIKEALKRIHDWDLAFQAGLDMKDYCLKEIEDYNE